MSVQRWVLTDPATAETHTMFINPNKMSSPSVAKSLTFTTTGGTKRAPSPPADWEWSGVIRSQAQHDALLLWSKKKGKLRVTDHLGRTFEVMIKKFDPTDRTPTPLVPWRLQYTMRTLLLRRIS